MGFDNIDLADEHKPERPKIATMLSSDLVAGESVASLLSGR